MSLMKTLKAIYVINLILCLVTAVSLIPLAQMDGRSINLPLVVAISKLTVLILTLMLLKRLIFYQRMKLNSKLVYSCHVILLLVTLI